MISMVICPLLYSSIDHKYYVQSYTKNRLITLPPLCSLIVITTYPHYISSYVPEGGGGGDGSDGISMEWHRLSMLA